MEAGETSVFQCMSLDRPMAAEMPRTMPMRPATDAEHHRLDEELQQDVAACVAPSALRMPISRVRSVTDTSMMFMMPMPPTRRLTAAIAGEQGVKTCVVSPERAEEVGLVADLEVVAAPGPDLVLTAKHPLNVGHRCPGSSPRSRRAR